MKMSAAEIVAGGGNIGEILAVSAGEESGHNGEIIEAAPAAYRRQLIEEK